MDRLTPPKPQVCFEVEKVIGISSDGSYQVQWAPAWVSKFHLVGCEHLIQEFLLQQVGKQHQSKKKEFLPQGQVEIPHLLDDTNEICQQDLEMTPFHIDNSAPLSDYDNHLTNDNKPDGITFHDGREQVALGEGRGDDDSVIKKDYQGESYQGCNLDGSKNIEEKRLSLEPANDSQLPYPPEITVKIEENDELNDLNESCLFDKESSISLNLQQIGDRRTSSEVLTVIQEEGKGRSSDKCEKYSDTLLHGTTNSMHRYVCSVCQKVYKDSILFTHHLQVHEKRHACNICQKEFTQSSNLKKHLLTHTKESSVSHKMQRRRNTSAEVLSKVQQEGESSNLDRAEKYTEPLLNRTESSKNKYVCSVCQKGYSDLVLFTQHLQVHDKRHVCNICQKQFSQSNNLKRHYLTHTKEKPFTCEHCGNSFSQKTILDQHVLIHECIHPGSRLYCCETCQKTFTQAIQLYKHKRQCSSTLRSTDS